MSKCQMADGPNGQKIWNMRATCSHADCGYDAGVSGNWKQDASDFDPAAIIRERDAALAVLEQIDHWFNNLGDRPVSDGETLAAMLEDAFQPIALARIKADAWDEGFTTSDEPSPYRDNPYREKATP